MIRQFFLTALLISFSPAPQLFAEPGSLRIHRIDTDRYPVLDLTVSLNSPYPEFAMNRAEDDETTSSFYIEETFRGRKVTSDSIEVQPRSARADRLYLVMVLDATSSISESDFHKIKGDARYMLGTIGDDDYVALYSFQEKPELESRFTNETVRVDRMIESLQRNGEKTSVYDALYSGVFTAKRAYGSEHPTNGRIQQSVVLLFTDGKEEKSSLKEEDLHELAGAGVESRIPVYTMFYGDQKNRLVFQRLAMKTGGRVLSGNDPESRDAMLDLLRRIPAHTYTVTYRSSISPWSFPLPGSKSTLGIHPDSTFDPGGDRISYEIPFWKFWASAYERDQAFFLTVVAVVFLFAGAALLVILLFIFLKRRSHARKRPEEQKEGNERLQSVLPHEKNIENVENTGAHSNHTDQKKEVGTASALASDLERMEEEEYGEEEIPDGVTGSHGKVNTQKPAATDAIENRVSRRLRNEQNLTETLFEEATGPESLKRSRILREEIYDPDLYASDYDSLSEVEKATGIVRGISGRGGLYIKEYSYHLLQQALRGAERYQDAMIKMIDPGPSGEFKEYDLFLEDTLIGSGRYSNIRLDDPGIMPVHARIKKVDGKFVVYDMMSRSGVYLNERKLLRPRALHDGDELKLGRVRFRFRGVPFSS